MSESDPAAVSEAGAVDGWERVGEGTGTSAGALALLRRGVRATPELRAGVRTSIALAVVMAVWRLIIPIALQQVIDKGMSGGAGVRFGFVATAGAIAAAMVVGLTLVIQALNQRLMVVAESVLYGLRTRAFAHVHRLSVGRLSDARKGVLVARVTSDVETLAQFASWGAMSWVVNIGSLLVSLVVLFVYSWQLGLVAVAVLTPVLPVMRFVQRRQLHAYDTLRSRVSDTLAGFSETISGIRVVRAYGISDDARRNLHRSIEEQKKAQLVARLFFSVMFPVSDFFGGLMLGAVAGVGIAFGPDWGLRAGVLTACLLLANQTMQPVAEIGEVLDQTQTALSGWKKLLDLLDEPVEVVEPDPGRGLPCGPLAVDVEGVDFEYVPGTPVLSEVSLHFPAGANVAIVGETGSGKTTLSKLLCRLADPTKGTVRLGGVDLREVSPRERVRGIRLVPQDGFLFDGSIADNVKMGREDASDGDVVRSFEVLGLTEWVQRLPEGLATRVGERGDSLSVGERQLVALARAELADPGLLILDEATSNVDPDTERVLGRALATLAAGRTTVSVAHRLSTAEAAELVVVFDRGRVVEVGPHDDLVARGGTYARLYETWLGNTRSARGAGPSPQEIP